MSTASDEAKWWQVEMDHVVTENAKLRNGIDALTAAKEEAQAKVMELAAQVGRLAEENKKLRADGETKRRYIHELWKENEKLREIVEGTGADPR